MFHFTPECGPHIFEWAGLKCYQVFPFSDLFCIVSEMTVGFDLWLGWEGVWMCHCSWHWWVLW